jgi:hypothetical protein
MDPVTKEDGIINDIGKRAMGVGRTIKNRGKNHVDICKEQIRQTN